MSNSEPSAIVLQGIPCICGLYTSLDSNEKTVCLRFAAIHPFEIAHEVSSWLGIARREPGLRDRQVSLRVHRHEARMTPAKRRTVYRRYRVGCRQLRIHELGCEVVMFYAPSQVSNLITKGPTLAASFAVQYSQRVEIWLPTLDTFRTFAA